jgi:hypothetical protein
MTEIKMSVTGPEEAEAARDGPTTQEPLRLQGFSEWS